MHCDMRSAGIDRHEVKIAQAQQGLFDAVIFFLTAALPLTAVLLLTAADDLQERLPVHAQRGQEGELPEHLPDRLLIIREAEDPAHQFEDAAAGGSAATRRDAPLDLMELQGLQLFEDFFEGSKAALLLEGSAEQLDEHDMFADGQNDLRHQHFVVLGPAAVRIDLFGKRKESAQRQLVLRVGETQRGVLGRHTGPRGEEEPDAGPHEIFQNVGVGQGGCAVLRSRASHSGRTAG